MTKIVKGTNVKCMSYMLSVVVYFEAGVNCAASRLVAEFELVCSDYHTLLDGT